MPYVTVSNDEGVSTQVSCTRVTAIANAAPITGCTCGTPQLVTSSNDVYDFSPVIYQWNIEGCTNAANENFTYSWNGTGITNSGISSAYGQYTEMGSYPASVTVTNEIGISTVVQCTDSARVENSGWTFRCNPDNSMLMESHRTYENISAETCMAVDIVDNI
jgi:hypothetical protein